MIFDRAFLQHQMDVTMQILHICDPKFKIPKEILVTGENEPCVSNFSESKTKNKKQLRQVRRLPT